MAFNGASRATWSNGSIMTDNPAGSGFAGQEGLNDGTDPFNAVWFAIEQFLGRIAVCKLVKVVEVHVDGDLAPVGFVDVIPLVNLIDGLGNSMKEGTVYNMPFVRLQGGKNAVIIDPVKGDLGIAMIADRDISNVKTQKDVANPGSFRRFSLADGLYIGGVLNGTPERYIQYKGNDLFIKGFENVSINATTKITVEAPDVSIKATTKITVEAPDMLAIGNLRVNGELRATGDVIAHYTGPFVTLLNHQHPANNSPPTPGH